MPRLRLGDTVPNFTAETTKGKIEFYEWQKDMWVVLFSHPKDFTPVCTSELSGIADQDSYFTKRNTKFLAHSCDSLKEHLAWEKDITTYCKYMPTWDLPFPIIADPNGDLARSLDLIDVNTDRRDVPVTSRPLYIIDPQHKLRFALHYPATTGRSLKEILRVLDSLQLCDRVPQVETPANWRPGDKVMIKSGTGEGETRRAFGKGTHIEYVMKKGMIRTTTDYELF